MSFWDYAEAAGVDPIVRKEMYGVSRRWTTYLGRTFYVFLLGLVVWMAWKEMNRYSSMEYSQYALLGSRIFIAFAVTQMILIVLAAIVQSSDMISKEIRQQTLGVLFLTPLSPWRIALGKFKSCLGYLSVLLLSGIPVLAISVYLGGVTALDLLAVTGLTVVTCAFCISFSLWVSTYFKGGAWGLVISIIGLTAYALVPMLLLWMMDFSERDAFQMLRYQNPGIMLGEYFDDRLGSSKNLWDRFSWVGSCLFTASMTALMLLLTAARLRTLAQSDRKASMVSRTFTAMDSAFDMNNVLGTEIIKSSRDVWEGQPFLWKELHTRVTGKLRYLTRICMGLIILLVIGMLMFVDDLMDEATMIVPFIFMIPMMIFWAIGSGSGTFSKEREENKWDILMTIPLDPHAFVLSKLAGAGMSLMPMVVLMLVFLGLPLLVWNTLIPFVPIYVTTFVFAAFVIVLGMFFSMRCATTRKAFAITLSVVVGFLIGIPFLILFLELFTNTRMMGSRDVGMWLLYATNPFPYLEWIDRLFDRNRYGYSSGRQFPLGGMIAYCVLYGSLSVGMLVHLVTGFDRMRHKG